MTIAPLYRRPDPSVNEVSRLGVRLDSFLRREHNAFVPGFSRRSALRGLCSAVSAAGLAPLVGCETPAPPSAAFMHGVASGDPTASAVILWTRLSGVTDPTMVRWVMARDAALEDRVMEGEALAEPARDFTVKVDVTELPEGSAFFYAFEVLMDAGPMRSSVGRTRTLARDPATARLGVVSCASLAHGYFHAYHFLAQRELDLVLHLGDAIYEFADGEYGSIRGYEPPHECRTLSDYLTRYAQYRRDPDVQAVHAAHPFVMLWDDHEFANNAYEEGSDWHDLAMKGPWSRRRDDARRAFFLWQPVREAPAPRVHRSFSFGALASLTVIDTRMDGRGPPPRDPSELSDPGRLILSEAQEAWVLGELARTDVRYRILAQAVLFAQHPEIYGIDAWDGFPVQRQRLLQAIADQPLPTLITLAGDSHASWATELALDPFDAAAYDPVTGAGAIGVELGVPGVTSPNYEPEAARIEEARILRMSPHTRFTEQSSRGYMVLELDATRALGRRYYVEGIDARSGAEREGPIHEILAGTSRLSR